MRTYGLNDPQSSECGLVIGVCVLTTVCLVINCQMAKYGHPPTAGNGSDWIVVC